MRPSSAYVFCFFTIWLCEAIAKSKISKIRLYMGEPALTGHFLTFCSFSGFLTQISGPFYNRQAVKKIVGLYVKQVKLQAWERGLSFWDNLTRGMQDCKVQRSCGERVISEAQTSFLRHVYVRLCNFHTAFLLRKGPTFWQRRPWKEVWDHYVKNPYFLPGRPYIRIFFHFFFSR